jgi:putative redox protein
MDLIRVTRDEGLRFSVRIRDHVVKADMSVEEGGRDEGLSPVELLGSSLGVCVAMAAQQFCEARGYTDGEVSVSLTFEMVENPNRVAGLVADVEVPRDVPDEEKEKLRKMALRFPVPASLRNEPRIDIDVL